MDTAHTASSPLGRIVAQEREAADRIAGAFDEAVTASLEAQEVRQ